jgi:hypothetical protein
MFLVDPEGIGRLQVVVHIARRLYPWSCPASPSGCLWGSFLERVETVATVGGYEDLEKRIKDFRPEPMTPVHDSHNEYYWVKLPNHSCDTNDIIAMRKEGYSCIQTIDHGPNRMDYPKIPPIGNFQCHPMQFQFREVPCPLNHIMGYGVLKERV